jgi:hypothetical protein
MFAVRPPPLPPGPSIIVLIAIVTLLVQKRN